MIIIINATLFIKYKIVVKYRKNMLTTILILK